MATLGDLKLRIIGDMSRDDLEDDLSALLLLHINSAVRYYKGRNWWFLATTATTPTVAAQNYITRPATIERISRASIPALGAELEKMDLADIEALDEPTAQTGQPCAYAEGEAGGQLRIWPTPAAVYTVKITGTKLLPALSDDSDDTVWTNEGFDLIAAHTQMTLYRDKFRDGEAAKKALARVSDAITILNETNVDRLRGRVRGGW